MTNALAHLTWREREALTEFLQSLQAQYTNLIQTVTLFGSKARGDDTAASDIDLLVVVNSDNWQIHKQIRYLAADISFKYDLFLSALVWSATAYQAAAAIPTTLCQHIQLEGIPLLTQAVDA
jgi:predicted nucleotidyltransferase